MVIPWVSPGFGTLSISPFCSINCVDSTDKLGIFLNVTVTNSSFSSILTTLIPDGDSLWYVEFGVVSNPK